MLQQNSEFYEILASDYNFYSKTGYEYSGINCGAKNQNLNENYFSVIEGMVQCIVRTPHKH